MSLLNVTEAEMDNILALAACADPQGLRSALERVAERERTTVAYLLCQMRNQFQLAPLHQVAMTGNRAVFEYIIDTLNAVSTSETGMYRSVINARSTIGTPLLIAVKNNHADLAQRLLRLGANPLLTDAFGGWIPLHHAVSQNYLYLALLLLNNDNSSQHINARTRSGESPLLLACRSGYVNMASLLLRRGDVSVDKSAQDAAGESVMHHAAKAHNLSLVRRLVSFGIPTALRNGQNITPYELAQAGWLVYRDANAAVAQEFREIMDELDASELAAEMGR